MRHVEFLEDAVRAALAGNPDPGVLDTLLKQLEEAKASGDEETVQRLERQINEGYKTREREFQPPFAQAHLDAYRFAEAGCEGCPAGLRRFTFRSVPRDERHGDGALDLDAEGHVRRVSYVPARLPAAAARAGIELVRGPVGPGQWGRERLSITFEGGLGPLQGSFRLSQRVSQHRRFPTVEAALAAMPR
jgi:hypothetical protein